MAQPKPRDYKQFTASMILLVVSCAANFYRPVGLLNNQLVSDIVAWAISFASGFGVPISLYFAAPYLGKILNFQRTADDAWLQKAREAFNTSNERALANAELEHRMRLLEAQKAADLKKQEVVNRQELSEIRHQSRGMQLQQAPTNGNGNGNGHHSAIRVTADMVLDWLLSQPGPNGVWTLYDEISAAESIRAYLSAHGQDMELALPQADAHIAV